MDTLERLRVGAPVDGVQTIPTALAATQQPDLLGEVLADTYEIRSVLGSGGMGVVYEAHDRILNRRVAVKVPHATTSQFSLRKEAQALAAVRHPSMVTVHAMGSHGGTEFLVMELVQGTNLQTYTDKRFRAGRRFTVSEALDVLIKIADGLATVHAAGISHRDIKPGNIMLATGNRIVLMDFGLFCPDFQQLMTIAGSPEYMAPEVYLARVEPGSGHLVDLYAFGIIAFYLLTGTTPFRGGNAVEILTQHVRAAVPEVAPERADIPADLRALVGALMAKDPRERPQSIADLICPLRAMRDRAERAERGGHFSVLLVDDDADLVASLRDAILAAMPDVDIQTVNDGEAALACIRKKAPDVLLVDLNMPRMNGLELCMSIRGSGLNEASHIVSISATAEKRDLEVLAQFGVTRFIRKTRGLDDAVVKVLRELRRRDQRGG